MNIKDIRAEFPIFSQQPYGFPLVYLDSAATAQKPNVVLDALQQHYRHQNANVHRGIHYLSEQSTQAFEAARSRIQKFIGAKSAKECIFVRGTTEAINLVAQCFGEAFVKPGDEILISGMEHHSNIVPWQMMCKKYQATLKVIPLTLSGELNLDTLDTLLNEKTKLLALTYVSNALGTINPVKALIRKAHAKQCKVLIDGAQAIPHLPVDVSDLNCDFFAFSSHKAYGPTGVGVLYGKEELLNRMPPYQGGGDMILKVSFEHTTYNELPYKFEAGTPAIAEVIGFSKALDFIQNIGFEQIQQHETELLTYLQHELTQFSNIEIIGTPKERAAVVSFIMNDIHPHDIATILDRQGVAIRSGHHCAMPIMTHFNLPATVRISLGMYNTEHDIDRCMNALKQVNSIFKK